MDKRYLTAPCGLDCFNCGTYEGNITEDVKKQVSEFLKIPVEETSCKGCRGENGHCIFGPGQQCATWDCVQEKGLSFCHECGDFPCELLAPTQKGAAFPHNMKVYNLCRMKLLGLDGWIEESDNIRNRYFSGEFLVGRGPILQE
jgi:hypothetical protein